MILWADLFFAQIDYIEPGRAIFYQPLYKWLANSYWLSSSIAFVVVFVNALLINRIIARFDMLDSRTFLPALFYIILVSSSHKFIGLSPELLASLFLILMLERMYVLYGNFKDLREVLNIGILCGLASMFYFPAVAFVFFIWIGFVVFQILYIRRIFIILIGLLAPYLFVFVYYFLTDQISLGIIPYLFGEFKSFSTPQFNFSVFDYVLYGYMALIMLISFLKIISGRTENVIKIRKMHTVQTWFLFSIIILLFFVNNEFVYFILFFIPFSLFIPNYFIKKKKPVQAEVMFLILIALIIVDKIIHITGVANSIPK
jgi:hypothetical protein